LFAGATTNVAAVTPRSTENGFSFGRVNARGVYDSDLIVLAEPEAARVRERGAGPE